MGKTGHQSLTHAQNKTLNESPATKIPVQLLEAVEPQKYTYSGEVELVDTPYQEEQSDDKKQPRQVWMFPIRLKPGGRIPLLTAEQARVIEDSHAREARQLSTAKLKALANKAKKKPTRRTAQTNVFVRDAAVAEYVKRLAKGLFDLCEMPAPFASSRCSNSTRARVSAEPNARFMSERKQLSAEFLSRLVDESENSSDS